jgi:hypothetical protein
VPAASMRPWFKPQYYPCKRNLRSFENFRISFDADVNGTGSVNVTIKLSYWIRLEMFLTNTIEFEKSKIQTMSIKNFYLDF